MYGLLAGLLLASSSPSLGLSCYCDVDGHDTTFHPACYGPSPFCTAPDDMKTICYTVHGLRQGYPYVTSGCLNITLNPNWQQVCNTSISRHVRLQCCDKNNCNKDWFADGLSEAAKYLRMHTMPSPSSAGLSLHLSPTSAGAQSSMFSTLSPNSGFSWQGVKYLTTAVTALSLSPSPTPSPTSGFDRRSVEYSTPAVTSILSSPLSAGMFPTPSLTSTSTGIGEIKEYLPTGSPAGPTSVPSDGSTMLIGLIFFMGVILLGMIITAILCTCWNREKVKQWMQRRSIEDTEEQLVPNMELDETVVY